MRFIVRGMRLSTSLHPHTHRLVRQRMNNIAFKVSMAPLPEGVILWCLVLVEQMVGQSKLFYLRCYCHQRLFPPLSKAKFPTHKNFTSSLRLQVHMHLTATRYVTKSTVLYYPSTVYYPSFQTNPDLPAILDMQPTPHSQNIQYFHRQLQSPVQPPLHPTHNLTHSNSNNPNPTPNVFHKTQLPRGWSRPDIKRISQPAVHQQQGPLAQW